MNLENREKFTTTDSYGRWDYCLDINHSHVTACTWSCSAEDINPSDDCEDLEEFEEELSELFSTPWEDSIQLGFDISEEEREIADAWIRLNHLAKNGYIIHVGRTGEEFLTDLGEKYIFIGTGRLDEWADYDGEKEAAFTSDEEGWKPKEGIEKEEAAFPDGNGGYSAATVFVQKNTEVLNPVDEYTYWQDDFEIHSGSSGYFFTRN